MLRKVFVVTGLLLSAACGSTAIDVTAQPAPGPAPAGNRAPSIARLASSAALLATGGTARFTVDVSDPDGDAVTVAWSASSGALTANGLTADWVAPAAPGEATITATATDGKGGQSVSRLKVAVEGGCGRILVDASKDGGAWWFPQAGVFRQESAHQGQALADHLRGLGYTVDEVGRGETVTLDLLSRYGRVLRAGEYGDYADSELAAYSSWLSGPVSLLLISEYRHPGETDPLAELLGIPFTGLARGTVSRFTAHPLTEGVASLDYTYAGSGIAHPEQNPALEILGWLSESSYLDLNDNGQADPGEPYGAAAMGVLHHPSARITFLGELNGLEQIPQPFTTNLVNWSFGCGFTGMMKRP